MWGHFCDYPILLTVSSEEWNQSNPIEFPDTILFSSGFPDKRNTSGDLSLSSTFRIVKRPSVPECVANRRLLSYF